MDKTPFFETAVRNLPGGLILVDLECRVQAVNAAAQSLLGLPLIPAGTPCDEAFENHPKIANVLTQTCRMRAGENRQELTTVRSDGEKIVLGYGTLILEDPNGDAVGVGMTFQDITRLIPLMDSHRFLDIALKNLPGGLVFVDLSGKVRGVNQMAQRLLGIEQDVEPGTFCHEAFANHPSVVKALLSTCKHLNAVNRQEMVTASPTGERLLLGYGTLILRNPQGQPVGVGMTFQDITRFIPLPLQTEFIRLVDRFFTPFAATMVLAAMWLGYAEPKAEHAALAIVGALVVLNEGSIFLVKRKIEWTAAIGYARLATNFVANVILVYLLGTFWGPMWLLFVVTPVATALHAHWKETIITSLLSAGTLLGIYASRGLEGAVGWGQASIHASFIVFISLFVNSIARMVMQIKSAGRITPPITTGPAAVVQRASKKPPEFRIAA